jgi:hypothetical protein
MSCSVDIGGLSHVDLSLPAAWTILDKVIPAGPPRHFINVPTQVTQACVAQACVISRQGRPSMIAAGCIVLDAVDHSSGSRRIGSLDSAELL